MPWTKKSHAAMVKKDKAKMKDKMEMEAKTASSRLTEMTCVLTIPKAEVKRLQKILNGPKLTSKQMEAITGESSRYTIAEFNVGFHTPNFDTEMFMDIKVSNGDNPFVDTVLIEDGIEVNNVDAVSDQLLGEYTLEHEGVLYHVIVREG